MKIKYFSIVFIFVFCNEVKCFADNKPDSTKKTGFNIIQLKSYENNILGYTFDSDDKPFLDFTLSARAYIYPFDYLMKIVPAKYRQEVHLNFAFSGRFAAYTGTRYSNPLIGKRFNPYLYLQYCPKNKFRNVYFETGYGHESNGQTIDDSATFFKTAALKNNDVSETLDYLSRGWDYFGGNVIVNYFPKSKAKLICQTDISIKYYLSKGLFEGQKEEYRSWESAWSGAGYTRNDVSGISVTFTCFMDYAFINRIRINYETGITNTFSNNSVKLIIGFHISNYQFAITGRYGYNGDLAQYGKLNSSAGISIIIPSFKKPENKIKYKTI